MQLFVGSTPYSQWQHLSSLLKNLGWKTENNTDPQQWLNNNKNTTESCYLLFYTPVHIAIAHAMDEGYIPSEALKIWKNSLLQCLKFYRQHRRQTLLFNVIEAAENPLPLLHHCQERFGINAEPVSSKHFSLPSALHRLLAQQLLVQQDLTDTLVELEASTTPLQEQINTTEINIDHIYQKLTQQHLKQSNVCSQIEKIKKEKQLLTSQLHQHQAKAHNLSDELHSLQATKDALKQDYDSAQTELYRLRQDKTSVEYENELILQQLHQVQEELEHYYLKNNRLEQQLNQYQQQKEISQQQLKKLTTSTSWKATTPIRILGRTFKKATPEQRKLKEQIKLLNQSELFNADWYLKTYPDVAESGMSAIKHYLIFGAYEGRNPSEDFDTNWYLQIYTDVVEAELNPLVHYLKYGREEGRHTKANT